MSFIREVRSDLEREAVRLLREYRSSLFREAVQLCNDMHTAEDLVMRTIETFFAKREDELPPEDKTYSWLKTTLHNLYWNMVRTKAYARTVYVNTADAAKLDEIAPADNSTDEAIVAHDEAELLRKAIASLPKETRDVIMLRYFESLSIAEIAKITCRSIDSVKCNLYYARKVLAKRLAKTLGRTSVVAIATALIAAAGYAAAIAAGVLPKPWAEEATAQVEADSEAGGTGETGDEPAFSTSDAGLPTTEPLNHRTTEPFNYLTTKPLNHPTTTEEQAMNTTVRSITAAAALAAALPAAPIATAYPADGWFLHNGDSGTSASSMDGKGSGGSGIQTPGGWTNEAGTVSLGMTAGSAYYVLNDRESNYLVMTPFNLVSYDTPAGASLTVTPGARLTLGFKGSYYRDTDSSSDKYRSYVTVSDVRVMDDALLLLFPAHPWYHESGNNWVPGTGNDILNGKISLSDRAELQIQGYTNGDDKRQIQLAATVTGNGTISSRPSDSSSASGRLDNYITGDLSGFTGNLVHYSTDLVTGLNLLYLVNEKSVPANPASGETAYVAVTNGAYLTVQNACWDSAANRSWDFGSGRTPAVSAGYPQARIIIRGRATGSSGFAKNGYGTLVFAGETDISGTATVSYGVVYVEEPALALTNSVTWSVTAGDATVHYPDSVEMPTLYLKATDTSGQSSMSGTASCGGWATTPSGTASKTAAVMKKKYVVDGGSSPYVLRSPNAINKNYVFGGNTLMVKNGVVVNVLSKNGSDFAERTLTVADLRVPAEGICKMQGASGLKPYGWGGEYTIAAGGVMDFHGVAAVTNNIYAKISGAGLLRFSVNQGATPPSKQDDFLYGDLSEFTGVIEAQATGSGTKPMLGFVRGISFPGDTAAKTRGGLVATNGVKLVFSASGTIGPNRGVDFGSGTRTEIYVAAGETVTISSDVVGASGFEKTGAGTLILTGKLRNLTGTVRVSEGTLVLPSESRCKSFTLDVAPGAMVVHEREPGLVIRIT